MTLVRDSVWRCCAGALLSAASMLLGACATAPTGGSDATATTAADTPTATDTESGVTTPSPRVDQISLLSMPVVLNWDDDPAPDGLRVRVYLFHVDRETRAVLLSRGTLEFVIYEGLIGDNELASTKPLHTWRYDAAQLRPYVGKTQIGDTYALPLDWDNHVPTSSHITFTVRLLRPRPENDLYARPVKLSMKPG